MSVPATNNSRCKRFWQRRAITPGRGPGGNDPLAARAGLRPHPQGYGIRPSAAAGVRPTGAPSRSAPRRPSRTRACSTCRDEQLLEAVSQPEPPSHCGGSARSDQRDGRPGANPSLQGRQLAAVTCLVPHDVHERSISEILELRPVRAPGPHFPPASDRSRIQNAPLKLGIHQRCKRGGDARRRA